MIKPCKKCGIPKEYGRVCQKCKTKANAIWQKNNPEKVRAYQKKYNSTKRHGNAQREMFYGARYRARKKGLPFTISKEDVVIPSHCPVLGIPLVRRRGEGGFDNSPSLDRIFPELGYVTGNINVISRKANVMKSNGTAEEVQKVANWMLKVEQEFRRKESER